jgi:pseudaminic acid synthase
MTASIQIAGRSIGRGFAPYIIAELSGNHKGDIARAFRLIEVAKEAGADAVKLQTYTADTITIDHDGPEFVIKGGLWDGRKLHDLYREAHTPWEWHPALFEHAKKVGITCFSSPFDSTAIDLLEALDAPAFKIASFEIVDTPMIRRAARSGKPLVISTGMASPSEIAEAVSAAREGGAVGFALLHCVSGYPTPAAQANLARIPALASQYDCPIGLSDHTLGIEAAITAVALGAAIVEKHVTLARADGGPDAAFSLEPAELSALVRGVHTAFSALGTGTEERAEVEAGSMAFRRSLYAVADIARGDILTGDNVRSIRPGYGLQPKHLSEVLGKHARRDIARGTPLSFELVE